MKTRNMQFIAALTLLCSGCGEYSPHKTVFVSGTVLLDGKPMAGINVVFAPADAESGHTAGGLTDAQGKYTLTTAGLKIGSGAVAGKYNVLFFKQTNEGAFLSMEEYDKRYGREAGYLSPKIIYHVPQKYGNPSTSGIEPVTVRAGQKNEFSFTLKSEPQ